MPSIVLGLGLGAALGGSLIEIVGGFCSSCQQQRITYFVGLPLAFAALLAAFAGAAPIVVRRLLMFAGLVFGLNVFLGLAQAGAIWFGGNESGRQVFLLSIWNMSLSTVLAGIALWGAFRRATG